jgi:small subunit ribosomal protein S8
MDTIGDMLTAIMNAQRVGNKRVVMPYSRFKQKLAELLQQKKMLAKVRAEEGEKSTLVLTLAYDKEYMGVKGVRRLSKPGQRQYVAYNRIPYSRRGMGMVVISTSQGLMDGKAARKAKLGGELICEVW